MKTDIYAEHARNYIAGSENWSDEKVEEVATHFGLLGRIGVPSDVSRVVAFLVSEDGTWMNDQTITIGGGAVA